MNNWSWKPDGRHETRDAAKRHTKKQKKLWRKLDNKFWNSQEWLQLRYAVLKKYGATCMCCGATRKDGVQIHVDHIKPRSRFPELALEFSNLQVLCDRCNLGKGNIDFTDWRQELTSEQLDHVRNI